MKQRSMIGLGLIAIFVLGVLGIALGWTTTHAHSATTTPTTVAAPAGAIAPSPLFLSQYDTWKKLSDDVATRQGEIQRMRVVHELQDEQDRMVGFAQRLNQQVPTGFSFDEKSRTFVPLPSKPATPPAPVAPPAVAPVTPTK